MWRRIQARRARSRSPVPRPTPARSILPRTSSSADYWTDVNVTQHHEFASAEESIDYFHWRSDQYVDYLKLMPVAGLNGKSVLDYGSGPGHDIVGFGVYSNPRRLMAMEVSPTSLEQAKRRAALHDIDAEYVLIDESDEALPLEDESFDYIHSSGVIHHTPDPGRILGEFYRILKPGGEARIMVYNYDSVFVHLYVAFMVQIQQRRFRGESLAEAFRQVTDGPLCPISNVYRPADFEQLAHEKGLSGGFVGASVSRGEMQWLPNRWDAIESRDLGREHRQFLLDLTLDDRGLPMIGGHHAGVDGCFSFRKG
jgi:SAM-dependent methyltransferase